MFKQPRFTLSATTFAYVAMLANIALFNWPLVQYALKNLDIGTATGWQTLFAVLVVVVLVSTIILIPLLIISRRLTKALLILIALSNSAAVYFMVTYQVILDRTMIGNIFNTDASEAGELFHYKLALYILVLGVLPAWLLWRTPIQKQRRWHLLGNGLLIMTLSVGYLYSASSTWLWVDKHAKPLGGMILPWGYMANGLRFVMAANERDQVQLPLADLVEQEAGPRLVVLVIGETARAQNFALYGYDRDTNPKLATTDVLAMNNAVACTTYTTASIKCMLAHENPSDLDAIYEYLPSYLNRHDVDVIWRTNNWGEPPITVTDYQKAPELRHQCHGENCNLDDAMLAGLQERIASSSKDKILVVLHQKGSHGPSYNKRYGTEQAVFTPVCESVNLSECDQSTLINAYDNSILHTDQFLYKTIAMLNELDQIPSAFIYMSDHGESLGEHGLYLHGTPYSLAPEEQKRVPMLVWMSPEFKAQKGLQGQDINWRQEHTHSLIFHSVIGAMGFTEGAYDAQQDIFSIQ